MRWTFLLLPLLLSPLACVEEPPPVDEPRPAEGPLADSAPPELVETRWWIGLLDSTSNDVIEPDILDGGIDRPEGGTDDEGTYWLSVDVEDTGDDGNLGTYNAQYFYAVSDRDFDADERLILRTSGTWQTWVGDRRQAGYVYNDGRARVATLPPSDGSRVVAKGVGGRDCKMQLWRTDDELYVSTADLTRPELVVGDAGERWLGIPVLNLTDHTALDLVARVVENDFFEGTTEVFPALGAGASSQVPFLLRPKAAPTAPDEEWEVVLQVGSRTMDFSYRATATVGTRDVGQNHWRTFRSPIDGSVQQYGVLPPSGAEPADGYALFLSLHGAGVQGRGQSGSYSAKEDAYIIAPTNRHPFGFDWEEWGRFNALASLDDAMGVYSIDPTQVYLTGHSMGGHGTWHVGTSTPGRFATLAPSAGWQSFYDYPSPSSRPSGALARSRAHSDTREYVDNLARRGVYIIHGDADTNVPLSQGQGMYDLVEPITEDLEFHIQPGAGHWWDADGDEPGADCVDWEPMIAWAREHRLDPTELDFQFRSALPSYSPTHSYVTIRSAASTDDDVVVSSSSDGATVTLDTDNARSLVLDGAALQARGVSTVVVNGDSLAVTDGPMTWGPQEGKHPGAYGPFNQAFRKPFCFVTPAEGLEREYAAYLGSYWQILGNGRSCSLTVDELTDAVRDSHQLAWIGVPSSTVQPTVDASFDDEEVSVGGASTDDGGAFFVFPRGDGVDAVLTTTRGEEDVLFRVVPFSSRSGLPDWLVLPAGGNSQLGFFSPEWE